MGINKFTSLEDYWSTDKCIGNEKFLNIITRTSFQGFRLYWSSFLSPFVFWSVWCCSCQVFYSVWEIGEQRPNSKRVWDMHSFEIDHFLCQPKTLAHPMHQSSKTWLDTSITFANFFGGKTTMYCMLPSRKKEQNICHVFIMWCNPLPSKRKKLFFTISLIS